MCRVAETFRSRYTALLIVRIPHRAGTLVASTAKKMPTENTRLYCGRIGVYRVLLLLSSRKWFDPCLLCSSIQSSTVWCNVLLGVKSISRHFSNPLTMSTKLPTMPHKISHDVHKFPTMSVYRCGKGTSLTFCSTWLRSSQTFPPTSSAQTKRCISKIATSRLYTTTANST